MKIIALGLVVIIAAHVGAIECVKYECPSKLDKPNMCANITATLTQLLPCSEDSTYCPISFNIEDEVFCKPKHKDAILYPGEYCIEKEECISGVCTGKVCVGAKENEGCRSDNNCNAGLACINEVCMKLVGVGEPCNATGRCDASTFCSNAICVRYGSIENGKPTTIPGLCKSFFLKDGVCVEGPKRVGDAKCINDACNYTLGGGFYLESCVCGRTINADGFCSPGKGDVNLEDVTQYCHN